MSYDIYLAADLGAGEETYLYDLLDWNFTSNCAPMWRAAGADLATFDGRAASECAPALAAAIATMESDPGRFEAMNPANGWGSYALLVPRLRVLHEALSRAPNAIVRVSR